MDRLQIYLFGGFRVTRGRPPETLHLTRTAQHLLAYLVVHRHRTHGREALAGTLWGETEDEKARACLNTALWRLRKIVEPTGVSRGTFVHTTASGEVGFRSDSPCWVDLSAFEDTVDIVRKTPPESLSHHTAGVIEKALPLYTGELLEGFYEEWIFQERERLHCLYVAALESLMHYHRLQNNIPQSLAFAQRLLQLEPFREDVHLAAMKMYQDIGQRFMALKQYEKCRESLEKDMGATPSHDMRRFYEEIAPGRRGSDADPSPEKSLAPDALGSAMDVLRKALLSLEAVHRDMLEALKCVNEIFKKTPRSLKAHPDDNPRPRRSRS